MRATAAQSARTEKPVYHIALSFSPENAVDRATMVQAADGLMNDLGLREPRALIIAHGDSRHPHVHLMINRVHPEAFRPWLVWDWRSRWQASSTRGRSCVRVLRFVHAHIFTNDGTR